MGFKEDLKKLSVQISERKVHVTNEEMTKQALIIPFIQILGYDVFNPLEVKPEYIADFGKKKGEKVDYALFKDGQAVAFVEAKAVNENLTNHDAQLSRYFNAVEEVKLGILTNGIEYRFYTDLTADNMMDEQPFLTINITDLKEIDIDNLSRFKKETFDREFLVRYAEELVYTSTLDAAIKELLRNPSDEFVRFIIKDLSSTRVTTNVIERFRPIVKKAISNAVLDIVSKGLYQQEAAPVKEPDKNESQPQPEPINESVEPVVKIKNITTTDEEIKSFEIIKNMLQKANKDIHNLNYKDTSVYFSIFINNINKWFIRINLDANHKYITTRLPLEELRNLYPELNSEAAPKGMGESRLYINTYDDIKKLDKLVIACYDFIA